MTTLNEIYKCTVCGNMVEVVHGSNVTMACDGQPMVKQVENTTDASREKHVPVVEKTATGILVKIGAVPHPMEEKHHIEWIEVITDGKACRAYLKPGMKPEAEFMTKATTFTVREWCNVHGLWKKD
jgi:superoxide reductase